MIRTISSLLTVCMYVALAMPSLASAATVQLPDFTQIVESSSPAVVKIIVEQKRARGAQPQIDPREVPEPLRRFFQYRGSPQQPQRAQRSMGSGFIISHDGYIVTNNHVVEGADSVLVRLNDSREYDAEIVGTDPRSDLALLHIEAKKLPVLPLAEAGELDVGEWVLAIGSPFGLDYSVSAGIVSAKGRSLPTQNNENYVPFIQTDVAINPGNSGGPLFNLDGEVVGVNSQIFTRSGGSIGLSFAIPVSIVRNVVAQLKDDGRVTRGWLGVTIQNIDKSLAESFGLDRPRGALISELAPDGPAANSGLKAGDVIISFNGEQVENSSHLPHIVGLMKPGTEVPVTVIRNRKEKALDVEVGGLDADDSYALSNRHSDSDVGGRLGLVVETVPSEVLERMGISGGIVVRKVVSGSAAAEAGIVSGDLITLIGSTSIDSEGSFNKAVKSLEPNQSVPVRLIRRGSPLFIGLKLQQ